MRKLTIPIRTWGPSHGAQSASPRPHHSSQSKLYPQFLRNHAKKSCLNDWNGVIEPALIDVQLFALGCQDRLLVVGENCFLTEKERFAHCV